MCNNTSEVPSVRLAAAPDSWGVWFPDDPRQTPWQRFLDEVVTAGYRATELGPLGYLPTDIPELRAQLGDRQLDLAGVTCIAPLENEAAWPALEKELRAVATIAVELNAQHLVLIDEPHVDLMTGKPVRDAQLDDRGWATLVATVEKAGRLVKADYGLDLVLHPHAETHVETESEIERLLEDTSPEHVSLCLDTGHHAYSGGDPVTFFDKHAGRIEHLHLKDVDGQLRDAVLADGTPFATAVADGVFVEPGKGTIDFADLRRLLADAGYSGWAVVEQDMYPAPFGKPLPIAIRTREHLVNAGFTV